MINIKYKDFVLNINFNDGMNISFLSWKGYVIISGDEERRKKGQTYGTPIMFPTPNRTYNNIFKYKGKSYEAKMHGLIRNLPFSIIQNCEDKDMYKIVGELNWSSKFENFYMYPFRCKLIITINIEKNSIKYDYQIINNDILTMAYGFGVHPFFNNFNGDATIMVHTDNILEAKDMINTGKVYKSKLSNQDLTAPRFVKNLNLDTVYYFKNKKKMQEKALIKWTKYQMSIKCSNDFTHMVVYTPMDSKSFCVEPQTCSIDAMNLFSKGFEEVSGIIELQPNEKKRGTILMEMSKI